MFEGALLVKVFGVGVFVAVGDILLRQAGKQTFAMLLELLAVAGVLGVVIVKIAGLVREAISVFSF